jgi:hypothetical protein
MAARHGSASRKVCRCDDYKEAHRIAARNYRRRKATLPPQTSDPGPVELAVQAEVAGLKLAASRPALVAAAVALGQVLDSPVMGAKASAAKVLALLLDKLHTAPVPGRGKLAVVRAMSTGGDRTRA